MTKFFLYAACIFLLVLVRAPSAYALTLADLENVVLTGRINYSGTFRRPGITYDADIVRRFTIQIGVKGAITASIVREVHSNGKVTTLNRRFVGRISQPSANESKDATVLWVLSDDTLTALNVFDVGGRAAKFKFTRTGSGMNCAVEAPFMREVGASATKITAAKGGKAEILKIRQTGSSCNAKKG